ncbi:T-cell immunomodulatory protein-like [Aphidius gifuensis]|uniref:T-cell immunomodulatory protein-like n=1 Tax=Aphidius gifuensis TaxID=684658 RepID=UPI001CDB8310|nr:T-cell immunomodulatory protein-like [Aphidius gifuensis]
MTSIVPGDYNGDGSMDILVTTTSIKKTPNNLTNVYVIWGNDDDGEPLIVDYNNDMIVDIFATNINNKRTFWSFENDHFKKSNNTKFPIELPSIRVPHANAFLDLNNDYYSDLVVTTDSHLEVWSNNNNKYLLSKNISWTDDGIDVSDNGHIGQSIYLDVQRKGKMDLIVPVCHDEMCRNCSIFVHDNRYYNLNINFTNEIDNEEWSFLSPSEFSDMIYNNMITLRAGDYNIDGYPDLLATLISKNTSKIKSFLLLNEECKNCDGFNRTFKIQWQMAFGEFNNDIVMAVFYDFYQDGILDIIMVNYNKTYDEYSLDTFINGGNYDATFIQVMVTSANLPGPSVSYTAEFLDDTKQTSVASQLSQSAHFSLNLPYIILGLGRTTNVVEELDIGISGRHRSWDRIIPNMQLVVTPQPLDQPNKWTIRQFIRINNTLKTIAIFLISLWFCLAAVIYLFWLNECKEDQIERKQNALKFHYDAL